MKSISPWLLAATVLIAVAANNATSAAAEVTTMIPFSSNPAVAARQRDVFDVVHRYEQLLNAADTAGILALYAPNSVAEWNNKPTFSTDAEKRDAYDALFRGARFTTVFGYAGIDVQDDTAVVRTFHHKGATVVESGKDVVDLNREVFVLHRIDGAWKIKLYIFNTDPVQGEG